MKTNLTSATLLLCLVSLLFSACETEIPLNIESQKTLIMNAFIDASDTVHSVSVKFTGSDTVSDVENAHVQIWVNDRLADEALARSSGSYNYEVKATLSAGDKVQLVTVTSDEKYRAEATVVVPDTAKLSNLSVTLPQNSNVTGYYRTIFTISAPTDQTCYYRVVGLQRQTAQGIIQYSSIATDTTLTETKMFTLNGSEDAILSDGSPMPIGSDTDEDGIIVRTPNLYTVFTNSRLGTAYSMTAYQTAYPNFSTPNNFQITAFTHDVGIRLYAINEELYNYYKALNVLNSDTYDDTFGQPIILPSNVSGGTGIVGIGNPTQILARQVSAGN